MNTEAFVSYAQNYEDVMLWRALKHVEKGFYVDVGANDPKIDSVTQAFYERGWRGINIEPVQSYYERLCEERPRDINLLVAGAAYSGELTLYEVPETGLSTIDPEVAEMQQTAGWSILHKKIPSLTLIVSLKNMFERIYIFLKLMWRVQREEY